jgi:seryl-tRNA synthetase
VLHSHVGNTTGSRSYYLRGELAELEQALIKLALTRLLSRVRLGGVNYLLL